MHCTQRGHSSYTHMFLWYTWNYKHCGVLSCIGLHVCSPPIYTRNLFLHINACVGCKMRDYHLYFYSLTIAKPSYTHSHLSMFWLFDYKINARFNRLQLAFITSTSIRGWHINWSGYAWLAINVKMLKNCRSIIVKVRI